jgi:LysM repeat protein
VDRICPFLALSTDHRTVVDGFDPEHACHAIAEPDSLDRARQAEQCLTEAHRQCDRYLAFVASRAGDAASVPAPASDSLIVRTRLVLDPEARRGLRGGTAPLGLSPRRWLVAGGVAAVGVAAAATAVGGGFGGLVGRPQPSGSSTISVSPTARPTTTPAATIAEESDAPSSPPSVTPTATPEAPRPSESAPTSPAAAPATYVVLEGDTLSLIATRFGTSVTAIQEANGLNSDVINIGQTLVIP